MFKRFFNALANLTASVDQLTASVTEANHNFRSNLGLDQHNDEPAQLDYHEPAKRKRTTSK